VELFLEAARQRPRALVIEGEAGAGKTSIWEAALADAQRAGSLTLGARPAEVERPMHQQTRRRFLQVMAGLGVSGTGLALLAGCSRLEVSPTASRRAPSVQGTRIPSPKM